MAGAPAVRNRPGLVLPGVDRATGAPAMTAPWTAPKQSLGSIPGPRRRRRTHAEPQSTPASHWPLTAVQPDLQPPRRFRLIRRRRPAQEAHALAQPLRHVLQA